jgi:hypothetical protein
MSDEPIFSVLSGKTQTFPNGFTVSGWQNDHSAYNGNYSNAGGGAFISDVAGDVFYWNGVNAWIFDGRYTGPACEENDFMAPCCCEVIITNSTGGGDSNFFPISGWTFEVQGSETSTSTPVVTTTLTFTAR